MAHFAKLKSEEIPVEVREARNKRRRHTEAARSEIEKNLPEITSKAIEKAKGGDVRAMRLCMDKGIGNVKSEPGVRIQRVNDPDPQVAANSVMDYLERGEINAEQAVNHLEAVRLRFELRVISQGMAI